MEHDYKMIRAAPVFWVHDIHAMIDFYYLKMGFHEIWKQGQGEDPIYAIVSIDGIELHLSPQKPHLAGRGYFHMLMTQIDAYWRFLQTKQIECVKKIGNRDYGMRDFMIRDLEGNLIEFGQNL